MADELVDFESFAGGGTSSTDSSSLGSGKGKPPAKQLLTLDEFAGQPPEPSAHERVFSTTLKGLKATGGEAASLADFVLSMPGFLISTGAEIGGTIQAAARGVPLTADPRQLNPVTAYTVGRESGRMVGEPLMNPVKKVLDLFKSGEAYEQAKTTQGMSKLMEGLETAGKWVENRTGGKVSRDSIPMFVDTLMSGSVGLAKPKTEFQRLQENVRKQAQTMRVQQEAEAKARELSPEEFAARVPVQQQINDMLAIRSPAEQARIERQRRADIKAAFRAPAEGSDYGSIEESQFRADERMRNSQDFEASLARQRAAEDTSVPLDTEAMPKKPERIGQAEILRILQKPGHERTAEDLITLREVRKQGGKMDPTVAALMASAGIGATVGATLDDDHLRGAFLGAATAGTPLAMLKMLGAGGVRSSFRQAGAVKGPGGMWHPEAVERLAEPLKSSLARNVAMDGIPLREHTSEAVGADGLRHIQSIDQWSDRAIRNYLNKYAGTERDPLKDVEIPTGEGLHRWEEILDAVVKGTKAKDTPVTSHVDLKTGRDPIDAIAERFPEEMIWNIPEASPRVGGADIQASHALTSYLSHVGDYLRQNVKPEDLQRYDLVRAVKETAENDKRVAKQMEKAAAASTKDLPVYKAYPNGYKWVELKLPEKLTEEQAKQVKHYEDVNWPSERVPDPDLADENPYVAVDVKGKPIENSFTNDLAVGKTPEEAWLAGRLAEEGNQMGHCAGGYCPSVASGESRIFSLRDEKGRSHVTVEVTPGSQTSRAGEFLAQDRNSKVLHEFLQQRETKDAAEFLRDKYPELFQEMQQLPGDITQIKGKQNRAPNKEYLPFVQDFVRSGKWGEVEDLEHTGLQSLDYRLRQHNRAEGNSQPVAAGLVERAKQRFGDQRFVTPEEFQKFIDEDKGGSLDFTPKGQRGFIDQNVVIGLTGLGLGGIAGWAMSDDPSGALLGALAGASLGLPGARARLVAIAKAADFGLGSLSTRIGNLSPALKMRAREYERRVLQESNDTLHRVVPLMKELHKLPKAQQAELERAILTNDPKRIGELMQGNAPLVAAWRETRNVLRELGEKLQGHGRFKTMLEDYFPRLVKDVEGLKAALGTPERTRLEQALAEGDKRAIKARGTPMTDVERSAIINREIQGFRRAKGYQPGFAKQRGVDEITAKLQPFYHTASESLYAYIRGSIQDLEMARFFGRDLVQTESGATRYTNLEASIGNLVGRELSAGKITHAQAQELIGMLQARFQSGERSPNRLIQEVRNLGNMGLLGNVVSAATQMSDTAMALYAQDMRATLTAVARQLSGREKITARDFGLADHISEEFVSTTKTADWLNRLFKYSGFSAIDRFGKTTQLNAAHARAERLARTAGGVKQLEAEYGKMFGDEFPAFIRDLKSGQLTERVRAYMFSELADMQPISKLEMPEAYLRHPNGRLVYMLKTFMLKQLDVIRRDSYNEIKKGNVAKGIKNLTEYALILGISGATTQMVQDWLMGRDVHFGAYDVMEQMLRTFGWGQYVRDKVVQGHPAEALMGMAAPPYKIMDDIIRRDPRAVQYIPIIGKMYYSWELGGKEAAEISRKRGTGEDLSEEAKDYQRRRREKAAERRANAGR